MPGAETVKAGSTKRQRVSRVSLCLTKLVHKGLVQAEEVGGSDAQGHTATRYYDPHLVYRLTHLGDRVVKMLLAADSDAELATAKRVISSPAAGEQARYLCPTVMPGCMASTSRTLQ
jgi:hypothetical protein